MLCGVEEQPVYSALQLSRDMSNGLAVLAPLGGPKQPTVVPPVSREVCRECQQG